MKKPGKQKVYGSDVIQALTTIWEICGRICSKRLKAFIPEMIVVLERHQELILDEHIKAKLLTISRASIDRCLKSARFEHRKGLSTTKPGTLLKNAIPVRIFTPWEDERPGFFEVDLVAHCGESVGGTYLNTLSCIDIATGWMECLGLPNKTQQAVSQAVLILRQRLPFPLLGLDSDNGSEFINDTLYRYCLAEQITFTRSRPYRKNDQAHVEQKNWSVVRHTIGYDRLETADELELLKSIYEDLRLYVNFFQPVLKLVGKEQLNGKTIKRYDQPATPFQRVLASDLVAPELKANLINLYAHLNPVALRNSIDQKVARLRKIDR